MSTQTEQNKAIVRHNYETADKNDLTTFSEQLAPDIAIHLPGMPGPLNRGALIQMMNVMFSGLTQRQHVFEDQIAEDDKVATRLTLHAVHTGEFHGMPATGKQIAVPQTAIHRIRNGKIMEVWVSSDDVGMMQQLGLIPSQADQ
ncbi:MAG TPA: ester cyclase [Anaerolineales bacterium]|nr:ester cyclase [Anaerolineales bacterium]